MPAEGLDVESSSCCGATVCSFQGQLLLIIVDMLISHLLLTGKRGRPEESVPSTASVDEHRAEQKRQRVTSAEDAQQQGTSQDHDMADAAGEAPTSLQGGGEDADMGEEGQQGDAPPAHGQQGPPTEFVRFRDDNTAFVRGLPQGAKESDLVEFFRQCGTPKSVRMPKNPTTGAPRVSVGRR